MNEAQKPIQTTGEVRAMFTHYLRRILVVMMVFVLCMPTAACDFGVNIGLQDPTLQELDKLINTIQQAPDLWQSAAQATIVQLGKTGTQLANTVSADLNADIQSTLGDGLAALNCEQDILGIRFLQMLEELRQELNPSAPAPVIFPVLCTVSPHQVDQANTQIVQIYGIRFNDYIKNGNKYGVEIQYGDGSIPKPNFRQVDITTNYLLQINLAGADWSGLNQSQDPRLVLTWGDQSVPGNESSIPVILIPQRTLYSIQSPTMVKLAGYPLPYPPTLNTSVNQNVEMPDGCALQKVQLIYWYGGAGYTFPPVDSLTLMDGKYLIYSVKITRINPTNPLDLGVNVSITNDSGQLLTVKVVYTVLQNVGVDCSVPNATSDNP